MTSAPRVASAFRRPPRLLASLHPSPRTSSQLPTAPRRPEGQLSEGGKCVETLRTVPLAAKVAWRPRRIAGQAHRSPYSPRSSSTPDTNRTSCLRRDATHRCCPAPSLVEHARSDMTPASSSEEPSAGDAPSRRPCPCATFLKPPRYCLSPPKGRAAYPDDPSGRVKTLCRTCGLRPNPEGPVGRAPNGLGIFSEPFLEHRVYRMNPKVHSFDWGVLSRLVVCF